MTSGDNNFNDFPWGSGVPLHYTTARNPAQFEFSLSSAR